MRSRQTSVVINEDLLAAVREILDTTTLKETIEQAFLEILRATARREEIEALSEMSGMDLADDQPMAKAWRQ